MSTITGISSSASVSYATQLAQSSALQRTLNKLGAAIQNGDLNSAGSILGEFVKANPQYAFTGSDGSPSLDPINQHFQALADAITNNQTDPAQSAWMQVRSDLAGAGVNDLSDGTAATAKLLAETKASMEQQILGNTFGMSSAGGISVASLLGGSGGSVGETGLSSSLIENWLTYRAGGNLSSPAVPDTPGNHLNTAA